MRASTTDFSFSPTFRALLNEAAFTNKMLGAGATQIRRAIYADKGVYFQAFTSLSTGIERIGKLCLMLDYYLEHGSFPDLAYMRREIGHQITLIHERTSEIVRRRNLRMRFLPVLSGPTHLAMIAVLSEFAIGDRYSNIDLLVGNSRSNDPISSWFERVDTLLFQNHVSDERKAKIMHNALAMEELLGSHSSVVHTSETGGMITSIAEASLRTGIQESVAPYRQLHILQIIRYWVEVLLALQDLNSSQDMPHFGEIFGIFYNNDTIFRGRKTWDRI
jgi:hypothetical protein